MPLERDELQHTADDVTNRREAEARAIARTPQFRAFSQAVIDGQTAFSDQPEVLTDALLSMEESRVADSASRSVAAFYGSHHFQVETSYVFQSNDNMLGSPEVFESSLSGDMRRRTPEQLVRILCLMGESRVGRMLVLDALARANDAAPLELGEGAAATAVAHNSELIARALRGTAASPRPGSPRLNLAELRRQVEGAIGSTIPGSDPNARTSSEELLIRAGYYSAARRVSGR